MNTVGVIYQKQTGFSDHKGIFPVFNSLLGHPVFSLHVISQGIFCKLSIHCIHKAKSKFPCQVDNPFVFG